MQRKSRKRPCRICRKWFSPDPRLGDRQKTCGAKDCQMKWHAKKCAQWNKRNPTYFREIYLSRKLAAIHGEGEDQKEEHSPAKPNQLPRQLIQEVIGAQHLVIIEYMSRLLLRSFQEAILSQLTGIIKKQEGLPCKQISRADSQQPAP